jgi:glycosyltransferase involved in cell wall biosynthesis
MRQPVHILFVVNQAEFFLSHRLPLALAAQAAGFEVDVATPESTAVEGIRRAGLRHHPVPFSRRGLRPLTELGALWALFRLYRSLRPQVVHHVTIKPVIYGSIMARLTRVPAVVNAVSGLGYIFISRGIGAKMLRQCVKWAYRLAFGHSNIKVIFQNRDDLQLFIEDGLVNEKNCILVRGSGVDLNRFVPKDEPRGKPVVLFASRLLRDKGVCDFVEAARRLSTSGIDARFVLVGDTDTGNPASLGPGTVKRWHEDGTIEWWGARSDMPSVLRQARIVCLPSYREGLPKILAEAAACGRAIVATDVPGCREIVQHENNGLLVPPRNVEALASALMLLLQDDCLTRRMGRRGREIAEKDFSVEQVISKTLQIYHDLINAVQSRERLSTSARKISNRQ